MASLRDLSVALMTSVANIDLSLGDNWFSSLCSFLFSCSANETFLPLVFAAAGFALDDSADFVGLLEFPTGALNTVLGFGNRSSLSIVAVAGVQVEVELTAARIESAVAWSDAMMIQGTERRCAVLLKIRHYTKLCHKQRQ
jgi:hypothetical protein